jgi:hypothetical protein
MAILDEAAGVDARTRVREAIGKELQRQSDEGSTRIDIDQLTEVVVSALESGERPDPAFSEGKRPDQLDATNDD